MKRSLSCLLLCAAGSIAAAQTDAARLHDGDRVRVSAIGLGLERHVAIVDSVRRDSLFLRSAYRLSLSDVQSLEVSLGRRPARTGHGAKTGFRMGAGIALLGIVVALIADKIHDEPCSGCFIEDDNTFAAVLLALPAMATGALVGAIMGARRPYAWSRIK